MSTQTFTFLFTDIEGSTTLLQRLKGAYADVLADHHRLIRGVLDAHGGREVDTQGDAIFAVFSSPSACVAAAVEMQRLLRAHPWPAGETVPVRMGIHSGEAEQTGIGLVGLGVHRAARVAAVAHGGQIVVSSASAALVGDSMPVEATLRDLGLHRLRDLGRPERIFQVEADGLPSAFPPLRSLDNPKLLNNLPPQLTQFVGREAELAEVRQLVTTCRLVTLTGAGGVGKTRLALQVAAGMLDVHADGVWFADLAPLGDGELVAVTLANVLAIREERDRSPVESVRDAIGLRSMLVVLDNCEHVIDFCARLADELLRHCPNVAMLATSREPLAVSGERVHRVPSLDTPADGDDVERVLDREAVRLFVDRAAQNGAHLARDEDTASVVGRVCRLLDGIPFAIELAAARLRVMSVAELDSRLDRRFSVLIGGSRTELPRRQTLLAMVDWSWELLDRPERHVLARLSVFAGGFSLSDAEAVSAAGAVSGDEVVVRLGALVDKNLVQFDDTAAGEVRYRLLETVRQYATRRLEAEGSDAPSSARRAHRDHYLAMAEEAAPALRTDAQVEWLDSFDLELDNIRAAIAFSLDQPDPIPGMLLATALRVFWKARGHAVEGVDALRGFLDSPGASEPTITRARALVAAAYLLEQIGGYSLAEECLAEALAIASAAGDEYLTADLLDVRAFVLLREGDAGAALPLIESGLEIARRLGDRHLTARLHSGMAFARDLVGDHEGAVVDAATSVELYRSVGDRLQTGTMLGNLGSAELSSGDLDSARRHLSESLEMARSLGDHYGVVYETFNLGLTEYLSGSADTAEEAFAESLVLATRVAMRSSVAYALVGLAIAGAGGTDVIRLARLHGAAEQTLAEIGETIEPLEGALRDADRERLRSLMGEDAFEAEFNAGRKLSSEEILELAAGGRS